MSAIRTSFCLKKVRIIGIRGIIHYSRQVCNLLFLAFQYSLPGDSTTAGEVCYLRLPCSNFCGITPLAIPAVCIAGYANALVKTCDGRFRSVEGHPRSSILVLIESAYAVSY